MSSTTNNENASNLPTTWSTLQVCGTLRSELENMRKAVTCPICLCCFTDPVVLAGCMHGYCAACLSQQHISSTKGGSNTSNTNTFCCSVCKTPATRRSTQAAPQLAVLVTAYKQTARAFGLAPARYDSRLVTLTQQVPSKTSTDDDTDYSDSDSDEMNQPGTNKENHSTSSAAAAASKPTPPTHSAASQTAAGSRPEAQSAAAARDQYDAARTFARALEHPTRCNATTTAAPHSDDTHQPQPTMLLLQEQQSIVASNAQFAADAHQKLVQRQQQPKRKNSRHTAKNQSNRSPHEQHQPPSNDPTFPRTATKNTNRHTTTTTTNIQPPPNSSSSHHHHRPAPLTEPTATTEPTVRFTQLVHQEQSQEAANHVFEDTSDDDDEGTRPDSAHPNRRTASIPPPLEPNTHSSNSRNRSSSSSSYQSDHPDRQPAAAVIVVDRPPRRSIADILRDADLALQDSDDDDDPLPAAAAGPEPASLAPPDRSTLTASVGKMLDNTDCKEDDIQRDPLLPQRDSLVSSTVRNHSPTPPSTAPAATAAAASSSNHPVENNAFVFHIGTIVEVQDRTGPGQNLHGGVARITNVHCTTHNSSSSNNNNDSAMYDLQYVVDRRVEKHVDAWFVSLHDTLNNTDLEGASLRSRRRSHQNPMVPDEESFPKSLQDSLQAEGFAVNPEATIRALSDISKRKKNDHNRAGRRRSTPCENEAGLPYRQGLPKPTCQKRKSAAATRTISGALSKRSKPETNVQLQLEKLTLFQAMTPSELCRRSDAAYTLRIETAMRKKCVSVCTTCLSAEQIGSLKDLCHTLKESNSNALSVQLVVSESLHGTSLCLIPCGRSGVGGLTTEGRSIKAMQASLLGVPLVSTAWMDACLEHKRIVVPETGMYARTLRNRTTSSDMVLATKSDYGVAFSAALADDWKRQYRTRYEPFRNYIFYLVGFSSADESDIAKLVRDAGVCDTGICVTKQAAISKLKTMSSDKGDSNAKMVVLCDSKSHVGLTEAFERVIRSVMARVLVVNSQWLYDSISCGYPLDPTPVEYKPRGEQKTQKLWELMASF